MKWFSFTTCLIFIVFISGCGSSSGSGGSGGGGQQGETVYLNQRLRIVFPESAGAASLTLNGNQVKDADFSSSSVYFDITLEALGGEYVEQADAVVRVGGNEVVRQPLEILRNSLASSELVVFTEGLSEAQLQTEIESLNAANNLSDGFALKPDSFTQVSESQTGTALLSIGQQSTAEALENIDNFSLSLQQSDTSLTASPNVLYGISRGSYWSSPRCDVIEDLDAYAANGWQTLDQAKVFELLGIDEARQNNLNGGGVVVPVLDTGINDGDVFDCPQTTFKEGHGTHVYGLVNAAAPEANFGSERTCSADGFCSTEELVQSLIELEERYLTTGQKVIVNLSLSGSRGLDETTDRAIWAQLRNYEKQYPNFLAIAAAGNHGLSDDEKIASSPAYPASFSDAVPQAEDYTPLKNVISVGTVGVRADTGEVTATAMNPEEVPVDLLAPGVKLCLVTTNGACDPGNTTEGLTGSSFATALTTSVAAIVWSECAELSAQELRELLKQTGTVVKNTSFKLANTSAGLDCDGNPAQPEPPTPGEDRIEPGSQQTGTLAEGQQKEYGFTGAFNTPLLMAVNGNDDLALTAFIIDPKGAEVYRSTSFTTGLENAEFPFTPQIDGEYTVRLEGHDGPGNYTITNAYVDGPPEERNQVTPADFNEAIRGVLAEEAFDVYTFAGNSNDSLSFSVNGSDGLALTAFIIDPKGAEVYRSTNFTTGLENAEFPFTPQVDGEYKVRLEGHDGPGTYTLFIAD